MANIYLDPLDWLMVQSGLEMVRYADDMIVSAVTRRKPGERWKRSENGWGKPG